MQIERLLVSQKELKTLLGIPYSPAHLARLEKAGKFPRRLRLGACRIAYRYEEVCAWVHEKVTEAERNQPPKR